MSEITAKNAGRHLVRTIFIILAILLVYAITVQVTEIDLDKTVNPERQEGLIRALRLLADPDIVSIDEDTGSYILSESTNLTIEFIIETIFMALLASTIGTTLAVPVSFLAARNLMEDITAPLAAIMAAVVFLPMGCILAWIMSSWLVGLATSLTEESLFGLPSNAGTLLALLFTGFFLWLLTRSGSPVLSGDRESTAGRLVNWVRIAVIAALTLFGLGLVAMLGLEIGIWLKDNLTFRTIFGIEFFGFLGDLIFVLSDTLHLLLPVFAAIVTGVIVGSYSSRLGQEAVLSWSNLPARTLTSLLTFLGTFLVSFGFGSFWNWLYEFDSAQNAILVPAIGGGLVIGVLSLALINLKSRPIRLLAGLGIGIASVFLILTISEWANRILGFNSVQAFTAMPALISGVIAAVLSGLGTPKEPYNIGFGIYTVVRAILNFLRSIEPLIMAIVFVIWVSAGPFAGILALTLHSIAALGKLFSEQIEEIDSGPVEAITATGASRIQMVRFAVIPQIVPPFTAFALYRWDINVRMSTIIGFVGGGGIGFILSQNIKLLRYREASVMMLAILIVVATLDYASAKIRSRII